MAITAGPALGQREVDQPPQHMNGGGNTTRVVFDAPVFLDAGREYALVIHEALAQAETEQVTGLRELHALLPHLPLKTAVQVATELSGGSRKALYALALQAQKEN